MHRLHSLSCLNPIIIWIRSLRYLQAKFRSGRDELCIVDIYAWIYGSRAWQCLYDVMRYMNDWILEILQNVRALYKFMYNFSCIVALHFPVCTTWYVDRTHKWPMGQGGSLDVFIRCQEFRYAVGGLVPFYQIGRLQLISIGKESVVTKRNTEYSLELRSNEATKHQR